MLSHLVQPHIDRISTFTSKLAKHGVFYPLMSESKSKKQTLKFKWSRCKTWRSADKRKASSCVFFLHSLVRFISESSKFQNKRALTAALAPASTSSFWNTYGTRYANNRSSSTAHCCNEKEMYPTKKTII